MRRPVFKGLFLFALGAIGWLIARSVKSERVRNDRVLTETRARTAKLKGEELGAWQKASLTRMGAYTTSIEETFLEEVLRTQPGGVVVDVGAAGGRLEHVLTRHADHVIATDLDRDEVHAMADDPRLTPALVGALPSLPLRDGAVDAVVAIQAPAASEEPWFREECRRVLRPGGAVLITLYNAHSYKGLVTRVWRRTSSPGTPSWEGLYYQRSIAENLRLWRAAGFLPRRMRGYYWAPLSRQSESSWVPAAAALERVLGLRALAAISPLVLVELRQIDQSFGT